MLIYFLSTDRGGTKIFDGEELLMTFERMNNNLVEDSAGNKIRTNKSDDWVCAIEDSQTELLNKIKKHSKFNNEFKIVDKPPTKTGTSIVKTFEQTFQKSDPIIAKAVRLGELKSILIKKDGTYVKSSDQSLIDEYENLQKEFSQPAKADTTEEKNED